MVQKRFGVDLDIKRPTSNREFEVVEGDTGNIIEVTLTDNGQPVDMTGCFVAAVFSKSDGTAMQDTKAHGVTLDPQESNHLIIELYTGSFAPGMVECEIQVFSGEENKTLVTSAKFNFTCRRSIMNDDTVEATDEYPLLIDLMDQCEDILEEELNRVKSEEERKEMEYLDNFNKELDRLIEEEKQRMKASKNN